MIQHADRVFAKLHPDPRFQDAVFFVNGENGAALLLWGEWERGVYPQIKSWVQDSSGRSVEVGSVGGEVLRYTFFFVRLNGHLVGFYESERLLADMKLICVWLEKTPAGRLGRTCNAINFGHCARAVAGLPQGTVAERTVAEHTVAETLKGYLQVLGKDEAEAEVHEGGKPIAYTFPSQRFREAGIAEGDDFLIDVLCDGPRVWGQIRAFDPALAALVRGLKDGQRLIKGELTPEELEQELVEKPLRQGNMGDWTEHPSLAPGAMPCEVCGVFTNPRGVCEEPDCKLNGKVAHGVGNVRGRAADEGAPRDRGLHSASPDQGKTTSSEF